MLCAIGRCPNTEGLFGEGAEPEMERGRVVVDEKFQSSIEGVYAIGDLVKGFSLHILPVRRECMLQKCLPEKKHP